MIIFRYCKELFSFWTTIVFTIVDIAAFIISSTVQSITFYPWVYWVVAGLGFIVANIQLYYKQEKTIEKYKIAEPKLFLSVSESRIEIPDTSLWISHDDFLDGLNDYGVPMSPRLVASVDIENSGKEAGFLEWELISVELGNTFVLAPEERKGNFINFSGEVSGRGRYTGNWELKLQPSASRIQEFAKSITNTKKFEVSLMYWTKRIGGKSPYETITISYNLATFKNEIATKWDKRGFGNYAKQVRGE